jgi:hypothetical protein
MFFQNIDIYVHTSSRLHRRENLKPHVVRYEVH